MNMSRSNKLQRWSRQGEVYFPINIFLTHVHQYFAIYLSTGTENHTSSVKFYLYVSNHFHFLTFVDTEAVQVVQIAPYGRQRIASDRKISWSLEAARFGLTHFNRSEMWQKPQRQPCRDACQFSERYDHYIIQSRGFEVSRDLAVRLVSV